MHFLVQKIYKMKNQIRLSNFTILFLLLLSSTAKEKQNKANDVIHHLVKSVLIIVFVISYHLKSISAVSKYCIFLCIYKCKNAYKNN